MGNGERFSGEVDLPGPEHVLDVADLLDLIGGEAAAIPSTMSARSSLPAATDM